MNGFVHNRAYGAYLFYGIAEVAQRIQLVIEDVAYRYVDVSFPPCYTGKYR